MGLKPKFSRTILWELRWAVLAQVASGEFTEQHQGRVRRARTAAQSAMRRLNNT